MKKFLLFFMVTVCVGQSIAQSKHLDSLLNDIRIAKTDTDKVIAQSELLNYYNANNDSANLLAAYTSAYKLAEQIKYERGKVMLLIRLATFYTYAHYDKQAKNILEKAEEIAKQIKNESFLAKVYHQYSVYYKWQDDYSTSLSYAFKTLKISEAIKDTFTMTSCYEQIGNNYLKQHLFKNANEFYLKAFVFDSMLNDKTNMGVALSNIGISYADLKQFEKAISFLKRSLEIKKNLGNPRSVSNTLNLLGSTYNDWNKPTEALQYLEEALVIKRKIKEQRGIAISLINIGQVYETTKNYAKAIPYLKECIDIATPLKTKDLLMEAYKSIANCYEHTNNFSLAYQAHVTYSDLKDSLYNAESQQQINDMQTKYGTEKKEQENKLLQTQNQLSEKTIKQQKITTFFTICGLIAALVFAFFIFRGLKAQRNANIIISKQKEEVHLQKELVEEKQKEILDSIHYAKRIQRAMITSDSYISQYVNDYFIFYQPKDIVSGDFYWALETNKKFYLVTADCTGHGVPGAFMSLLNISILNEVMIEKKIERPDFILNEARKDIIKALNPKGSEESKDGMDCILACFDFDNLKLQFAAANNSFYIVRNNELLTCKADKMPVGKSPTDDKPFTYNEFQLQKNDVVYMLTDGLPDQFGGSKGKKFKYKQLEDILVANHTKPLSEQKQLLELSFNTWKGKLEQVDDVLLIGVRV